MVDGVPRRQQILSAAREAALVFGRSPRGVAPVANSLQWL